MTQVSAPAQHEGQTSSAALFFALDVIAAGTIEYFTHLGWRRRWKPLTREGHADGRFPEHYEQD